MQLTDQGYRLTGNIDPLELVERFDSPLYVYDSAIMKRQYDKLISAFDVPELRINYAMKALNNINVLRIMKQLGAGLDTVSIQEVWQGLQAGFEPQHILYTPNCVSVEEISMAVEAGVRINIDNISVLEEFGHLHPEVPVCIRINPHIMAGGNTKISVGHIDSKFGISVHQLPHLLNVVEATGLTIEGLHMHTGSDILDADVFLYGAEILFNTAIHFPDLEYLDFGSGFKVPYKDGGIETDLPELGAKISERFREFCTTYGRPLALVFEPGKYLVSESGYFLVQVNVVKTTPATVFAGIDSGLNHLIRPMFYDAYHEIINLSRPTGRPRVYTVVGYICETDTFASNRKVPEVQAGDILCMLNAGAYCFSMASNYNSRFRPAEVLLHQGTAHLIRKRESMDDIMRNQLEVPELTNVRPVS